MQIFGNGKWSSWRGFGGRRVRVYLISGALVRSPSVEYIRFRYAVQRRRRLRRDIQINIACVGALRHATFRRAHSPTGCETSERVIPPPQTRTHTPPPPPSRNAIIVCGKEAAQAGGWHVCVFNKHIHIYIQLSRMQRKHFNIEYAFLLRSCACGYLHYVGACVFGGMLFTCARACSCACVGCLGLVSGIWLDWNVLRANNNTQKRTDTATVTKEILSCFTLFFCFPVHTHTLTQNTKTPSPHTLANTPINCARN